jgi:hypothetical protein
VASATFLEELLGVGHMAMLGRFRRRIATAAISRWVFRVRMLIAGGGGFPEELPGVASGRYAGGFRQCIATAAVSRWVPEGRGDGDSWTGDYIYVVGVACISINPG